VGHDFNNLLTVITGYTDLLVSDLPAAAPMLGNLGRNQERGGTWVMADSAIARF
jgi:hypothetical protein